MNILIALVLLGSTAQAMEVCEANLGQKNYEAFIYQRAMFQPQDSQRIEDSGNTQASVANGKMIVVVEDHVIYFVDPNAAAMLSTMKLSPNEEVRAIFPDISKDATSYLIVTRQITKRPWRVLREALHKSGLVPVGATDASDLKSIFRVYLMNGQYAWQIRKFNGDSNMIWNVPSETTLETFNEGKNLLLTLEPGTQLILTPTLAPRLQYPHDGTTDY